MSTRVRGAALRTMAILSAWTKGETAAAICSKFNITPKTFAVMRWRAEKKGLLKVAPQLVDTRRSEFSPCAVVTRACYPFPRDRDCREQEEFWLHASTGCRVYVPEVVLVDGERAWRREVSS